MHPVWPSLPELDAVRPDPPPAPMLWNWNLINTGKLTFRMSLRGVKGCSVDYLQRISWSAPPQVLCTDPHERWVARSFDDLARAHPSTQ
jgi:hypothetical protein